MTLSNENDLICIGCGATLQSEDPKKSGYVPISALSHAAEEEVLCRRCFRLRHYNEVQDVELSDDDFLAMMHDLSAQRALIVYLMDLTDISGTFISGIGRFAGANPILVVGNKQDLLPQAVGRGKVRQWLVEHLHEAGVRPLEVTLTSSVRSQDVKQLMDKIDQLRQGRDVYVVGATNVGKSTLINQIVQIATSSKNTLTTSYFPGTTLGLVKIPLADGRSLVDTPGIILSTNYTHYLEQKELKAVVPKKEIKPKNYPLRQGQTLFWGGLARIDYVKGAAEQQLVCYLSNALKPHRTTVEKAADLYHKQLGQLLQPPYTTDLPPERELVKKELTITRPSDVVIAGLGWFTVHAVPARLNVWVPEHVEVTTRRPLI